MTFCTTCGHQIHETAPTCPQCGAVQPHAKREMPLAMPLDGTLWLPVPALVCSLIAVVNLGSAKQWTQDEFVGTLGMATAAIVLGVLGLTKQKRGKGMSIAGLVLGVLSVLAAIGSHV